MDILKQCALKFESLLDIEYKIKLGRKGILKEFTINFEKADFPHLIGLQKLKDKANLKNKRDKIFDDILGDKITYEMISSSLFFKKNKQKKIMGIEERINSFVHIIELLDSNNIYFKYNQKMNPSSKIECEYVLENSYSGEIVYIFLDKRGNSDYRYCRSFFPKNEKDYTLGQARMSLLYKEKINHLLHESKLQLDKLHNKNI